MDYTPLRYVWQVRQAKRTVKVYLPLEFEPGQDGQVDWGEAEVILAGQQVTVQLFVMRLYPEGHNNATRAKSL